MSEFQRLGGGVLGVNLELTYPKACALSTVQLCLNRHINAHHGDKFSLTLGGGPPAFVFLSLSLPGLCTLEISKGIGRKCGDVFSYLGNPVAHIELLSNDRKTAPSSGQSRFHMRMSSIARGKWARFCTPLSLWPGVHVCN